MKTLIFCSSAIPVSLEERAAKRPIARDNEWYQRMLAGYQEIAILADERGFDAFGSTEHHFQTEGGESIPNGLLLYAKLAALTKRIMFVPLSVVLATHDPLRVAEDLALFSHMYPGRLGVAFARGYQTRWLQTLAQDDSIAALGPSDAKNREVFDEYIELVETAWEKDSFTHSGKHYQAPYPASGIPNWPLADWTRAYGAPGDVDDEGAIRKVGTVPKPLNRPTIFIPSTTSNQTVIDSARHRRTLLISAGSRERIREVTTLYRDSAREAGRDLRPGEGIGVLAKVALGDTYQEAFELAVRTSSFWHQNFFQNFYFNEAFRTAADDPNRPVHLADERALTQRMIEAGQLFCGPAEQVLDQMRELVTLYGAGKIDWFAWEYWNQSLPGDEWADVQRYQLGTYAEKIMPALR